LCIRARDAGDLDRLRARYLPTLTETLQTRGGDYRCRAWVSREALAQGFAAVARDLDHSNFKDEVYRPIRSVRTSMAMCGTCSETSKRAGRTADEPLSARIRRRGDDGGSRIGREEVES
jgi:hypothetical protein